MSKAGWRRMGWVAVWLLVMGGAGYGALQYAISQNGPAVLNAIDRLAGGARNVELVHRETIGTSPRQKILVYNMAGDDQPKPVIIFFHGGSWNSGDPDDYTFVARALVPKGFTVVLAGYRLVPGGEYPAMLEDTAKAVAWAKANIGRYNGDAERIFIAGHSAGAYNAVQVALDPQWLAADGLSSKDISGVIGMSGPYDFLPLDSASTKAAFGAAADLTATQPVNHVHAGAPPMLLIHGEQDTLVYPRNSRKLAADLTKAGDQVTTAYFTGMDHNAPLLALASPWRRDPQVLDTITSFVDAVLEKSAAERASVPVQG